MSMGLRYKGGFHSLSQVLYEIEIYQEGYSGQVSDIAFCEDPLEIEWPETDKLEPVQSSNATLQLYSDNDRQFIDLYTIKAGSIRMDVLRDGMLYWSGTLDPELYEEPFAYKTDYGVEITFADMAILDRLNWNKTGFMTIREIIGEALGLTGIKFQEIEDHISTKVSQYDTGNILDAVSVNLDNFYDEDGEPMTVREVLDETLRPFALRLIHKGGKIFVYDLNDIYTTFNPETIVWDSDDSVVGVDKVYNNVTVTFSPYENMDLMKGEVDPDSVPGDGMEIKVDRTKNSSGLMTSPPGFRIAYSDKGKGVEISDRAAYYRIDPIHSGEASAGVAWTITVTNTYGGDIRHLEKPSSAIGGMVLKVSERPYLGYIGLDRRNFRLKLTIDMLFDPRYNPFEEASKENEEGNWEEQQDWANFAYVPFILTLRDKAGKAIYHWENKLVKDGNSYEHNASNCRWVTGEGSWGDAWFCWYEGNRKNESGLGGWQTNKQIIGYYRGGLPILFDKAGRGEFIDLPDKSGYLELQVGYGVPAYDYEKEIKGQLYEQCRWILYKNPAISLVDKNYKNINAKDFEHKAWINRDAKEYLKIDTILGTMESPSPVAKGQLYKTSDYSVISEFYRAGVTDLLERLLIGTVYSNYASRHNTLSGTVILLPEFNIYTDVNEPGKYIIISETQRLYNDESEILMTRFDADNYEGLEFDGTI